MAMVKITNTAKDCVWKVLDKIGDRTSLNRLMRVSQATHDKRGGSDTISYLSACSHRLSWRREKGKSDHDCRTYRTQTARDMIRSK